MSVERAIKSCKECASYNKKAKGEDEQLTAAWLYQNRDNCRIDAQQALETVMEQNRGWIWNGAAYRKADSANVSCMNCDYSKAMIAKSYKKK